MRSGQAFRGAALALLGAALCALAAAAPAASQAPDQEAAGLRAWRVAGCAACHGTFGEGGGGGEQPEGPSLRRSRLDRDTVLETVRCGRPNTKMPYFLRGAYTEVPCWELPLAPAAPAEVMGSGVASAEALDALVAYLFARVVGKPDTVTKAECAAYFGSAEHPRCGEYN